MEAPIREAEVKKAINAMKTGKSPGVDGFTAEYYQKFTDILAPFLTKVFQEAFQYGTLPDSFNKAILKLLSKDDKDLTDPTNFGPISLINVDYKILSKILAARLETVLPQIVHKDQVGFIKHQSSADNMRRLLHLMWANKNNPKPVVIILLDAQKAFDRVEWSFFYSPHCQNLELVIIFVDGLRHSIQGRKPLFSPMD